MPCWANGRLVGGNGSCSCDFSNGGESIGASRTLGNLDNYDLGFLTNGVQRVFLERSGTVGIGTVAPNTKAILDLTSTTRGFLPPRMTSAQRAAIIAPPDAMIVWDTDLKALTRWDSGKNSWYILRSWQRCGGGVRANPATYNGVACTGTSTFTLNNFWTGAGYSGTSDNAAICTSYFPARYVPGTEIDIELHWASNATSGNTYWGVGIIPAGQNEALGNDASATYKTVTSPALAVGFNKQVATVSYSAAEMAGADILDAIGTVIYRQATNPIDNITDTALLVQWILKYWSRD